MGPPAPRFPELPGVKMPPELNKALLDYFFPGAGSRRDWQSPSPFITILRSRP